MRIIPTPSTKRNYCILGRCPGRINRLGHKKPLMGSQMLEELFGIHSSAMFLADVREFDFGVTINDER
jgi:hypothetical protein